VSKETEKHKNNSQDEASRIIENARKKATQIIADTNILNDSLQKQFDEQIRNLSSDQTKSFEEEAVRLLQDYKKSLGEIKDKSIKTVSNISKDIEITTESELKDFKEIIKEETYASQKIVEKKLEESFEQAKQQIEAYKKNEFKKIDDKIYEIINRTSEIVLGSSLPIHEHEKLILAALEKAKEEGALTR